MPNTKDTIMGLGVAAAVAMGAASLVRAPAAQPHVAGATAPSPGLPPPCASACAQLATWCPAGRAVNCVDLLTRYERADSGPRVDCSQPITQETLDALGWCPDGGEAKPLFGGGK